MAVSKWQIGLFFRRAERVPSEMRWRYSLGDEFEEDDYEPEFDCHMDQDGYCGKAGSEECDFECPYGPPQN